MELSIAILVEIVSDDQQFEPMSQLSGPLNFSLWHFGRELSVPCHAEARLHQKHDQAFGDVV
jgi:hypothetical protein